MMLKIGLTGGIGSGKSTVAKALLNLGVPVFFADQEAKTIMETSTELRDSVKANFGDEAYTSAGLNRKYLSDLIFNDEAKRHKLNQLVHPKVRERFEAWTKNHENVPYVVEEAALIFESGGWNAFDYIVLVTAPETTRIQRIISRDGATEAEVRARMNSQMSESEKITMSHYLIFNDEQNLLLPQVLAFHTKMISLSNK